MAKRIFVGCDGLFVGQWQVFGLDSLAGGASWTADRTRAEPVGSGRCDSVQRDVVSGRFGSRGFTRVGDGARYGWPVEGMCGLVSFDLGSREPTGGDARHVRLLPRQASAFDLVSG